MFCDDITNNHECGMDGGDCCDSHSFFFACHHCVCFDMSEYDVDENTINSNPSGGEIKKLLISLSLNIFPKYFSLYSKTAKADWRWDL